jgi:hypothetical protein
MHEEFNRRLLQEARAGNRFIVVIDEAQNLEPSVLETVRLLSDFETPRAKLMHIILAGQPELADKLASPGLSQLRQRVSIVHGLVPLSPGEIKNYIEHRLRIAGYQGEPLFTPDVYEDIARFTEGIPRNINNFCFNALSLTCALQKKVVDSAAVREVIADLDISKLTSDVPADFVDMPYPRSRSSAPSANGQNNHEILSPAEAAAYMQQVAAKLKNWQDSLDKAISSPRRGHSVRARTDVDRS